MRLRWVTLAAALIGFCLSARTARAHEPLWGESPQTFAFGGWHPELRLGFENDGRRLPATGRAGNPDLLPRTRLDGLFSLQYARKTSLNVRIDIPFAQVLSSQ